MEKEIASKVIEQGIVGIFIALMLIFLFLVIKFLILPAVKKEKETSDQLVRDLQKALSENTASLNLLKRDLNRYYFGMKFLAGEKWPAVRGFIEEDQEKR